MRKFNPWAQKAAELRGQPAQLATGLRESNPEIAARAAFAEIGFVDPSLPTHFVVVGTKTRGGIELIGEPVALAVPIDTILHFAGLQMAHLYDPQHVRANQQRIAEGNRGQTEEKPGP